MVAARIVVSSRPLVGSNVAHLRVLRRIADAALDPRVRVVLRHRVIPADRVELVALEPDHHPRRHAEALAHERHRAGEVFAVAALEVVEERDHRVLALRCAWRR
jgi:hypothetical protein